MNTVSDRLSNIRERVARADCNPDEVAIVAVTKGFGVEVCREALDAGLQMLGENRVQEALGKMEAMPGAQWHLIGHLQTNKVKQAAGHFALIQTVDSVHLADALMRVTPSQRVLVEVNVAREPQRSGVDPDAALDLIAEVAERLDLQGLMAMGPSSGDPSTAFKEVREIRDRAEQLLGRPLATLSMGMSGDFEVALAAGSTMLRLGQALFGPRATPGARRAL